MKTVSMKPVVQKPRKDGFWAVYIRFTFDGRCQFWKTSKVVSSQNVKSKSEITDSYVLSFCSSLILQYDSQKSLFGLKTFKIDSIFALSLSD